MKFYLHFFLLFSSLTTLSQVDFDTLNKPVYKSVDHLEKKGYYLDNISDFPIEKYNSNAISAWWGIDKEQNVVALFFQMKDSTLALQSKSPLDSLHIYFHNSYAFYKEGKIEAELQERWDGSVFYHLLYRFESDKLVFEKIWKEDLNEDIYKLADSAIINKDPATYCGVFIGAQYLDISYSQMDALKMADTICAALYQDKKYASAAAIMYSIEKQCKIATSEKVAAINQQFFKKVWGNASLYYLKAGMDTACVELCVWLTKMYPEDTSVYLQWGDALYNLGRHDEAKVIYKKYSHLMKSSKQKKQIPTRVNERIK